MLTQEEFDDLYKKGYARACSLFYRAGVPPDLCDDVAQDMYLRMWEYRHWKTDSYTPLTFWYLNLRYAYAKLVPFYKSWDGGAIQNQDTYEFIIQNYPDTKDPYFDVHLESLLKQLPEPLAAAILVQVNDGTLKDHFELLHLSGFDPKRSMEGQWKKIQRLKDSDEVKEIFKEYFGR